MPAKRMKAGIITQTSFGIGTSIEKMLIDFSIPVYKANYGSGGMTFDNYKDCDVIFVCINSTLTNGDKQVLRQLFDLGISIIDITSHSNFTNPSTSYIVMEYGVVSTLTYLNNMPGPSYIMDDAYKIGKKSGLATDRSQTYDFRNITGSNANMLYTPTTDAKILYTDVTDRPKAILVSKGSNTSTITNFPAHFIGFSDISSGASNPVFGNGFTDYMKSILDFVFSKYMIKGTVKNTAGVGIERDIFVYLRGDGSYIGKTKSLADGTFSYNVPTNEDIFVVVQASNTDTKATVVYDKIAPSIILY